VNVTPSPPRCSGHPHPEWIGATAWSADDAVFHREFRHETLRRFAKFRTHGNAPPNLQIALRSLTGLDPLFLLPALLDIEGDMKQTKTTRQLAHLLLERLGRAAPSAAPSTTGNAWLPAEHPLDYDWRFTDDTRARLADTIGRVGTEPVLLLGCPTLALDSSIGSLRRTLVDDNPALATSELAPTLTHMRQDLIADPGCTAGLEATTAVGDPPFYPDAMTAYAYAAASGVRVGGKLHFVVPNRWARPSAARDVAHLIDTATTFGLTLTRQDADGARYRTPKFERAAYARSGYAGVPDEWRTADILTFTLISPCSLPPPLLHSDRGNWGEVSAGGLRWRINASSATVTSAPDLLGEERLLTTVSRRDPRRAGANVFTDDNRAYRSPNPVLLAHTLHALAEDGDAVLDGVARRVGAPLTPHQKGAVQSTIARIRSPNLPS